MDGKIVYEVSVTVILSLVLNLEICYGDYNCCPLSSEKNICLILNATARTFDESKQFCQNNGGFLLEIYDKEIQDCVVKFGGNSFQYSPNVWLNLIRINSNVWVWGDKEAGYFVSYTNWVTGAPSSYDSSSDIAFTDSNYHWLNSYDPHKASTICIQGGRELYLPESTTSTTNRPPSQTLVSIQPNKGTRATPTVPKTSKTDTSTTSTTKIIITTSSTASSPNVEPIQTTTPNYKLLTELPKTGPSSSTGLGLGIGLGLGVLVLIIVSSLLVAKFVFHKEIPVPCKSSRNKTSTALRSETSHHINTGYEQIHEKLPENRSTYAEVVMSKSPEPPSNSNLNYVGFQDLNQSSSGGPAQAQNFVLNV